MTRVTKLAEERRKEILDTAKELFLENGFENVSVNEIIKEVGVAKGTFYHHFVSKQEVLNAIVEDMTDQIISYASSVAEDKKLNALEKMEKLFLTSNPHNEEASKLAEEINKPQNRELNEKTNVLIIYKISPIVAKIIDQGIEEGVFKVKHVLETSQFLITASQFLFDEGLFKWSDKEWKVRREVMQEMLEKGFGAKKGVFSFIQRER